MAAPISVLVRRGDTVESTAPSTPSQFATARSWPRRATEARHLHALVGEAAPGAAARARLSRPRRPGAGDRVCIAPRRSASSSAPCASLLAQRPRAGGRARVRPRGRPPRRSGTTARASTRACSPLCRAQRLAHRGLPACRTTRSSRPCSGRDRGRPRSRERDIATAVDGCGVVTFALPLGRWRAHSRGSREARRPASASPPRCAPTRADPRRESGGHDAHASAARLDCEGGCGGPHVRGGGGPGRRAQGRGRRRPGLRAGARRFPRPARSSAFRTADRAG